MRSGFRPRDRDRTTESMEWVWMGFGPLLMGVGLQDERGFYGYPVNHWSIKRPPNGTKLDRRSTGAIPRPLGKTRSIPRMFNTHARKQGLRGATGARERSGLRTDNGENRENPNGCKFLFGNVVISKISYAHAR